MASVIELVARQAQLTFSRSFTDETFSECLSKLKRCVGQVRASDVNLSRDLTKCTNSSSNQSTKAPVTYIEVVENQLFSMGIFVLRSGARIPLHDHPGMYGVLKVIHGNVKIVSFSALSHAVADTKLPRDVSRKIRCSQKELVLPVERHSEIEIKDNDDPCILSPTEGNFHEIRAVGGPAAFLDILAPPYNMKDRDCHYYIPLETSKVDSEIKTWLLKTSPPADFWCDSAPYRGPTIKL